MADLKTNYVDDVLDSSKNQLRKYQQIQNDDGTVSFVDVTEYTTTGTSFGAKDINDTNTAVNELNNSLETKQDKSTAINTSNIGNQTVANSVKCGGLLPISTNKSLYDALMVRNISLSSGNAGRLTGIGYDGVKPYLVIDGSKHHFNIVD